MKKFTFINLIVILTCFACKTKIDQKEIVSIKGDKTSGGELTIAISDKINNLFPASIDHLNALQITSQIYETLFSVNPNTLEIEPNIAKSFKVNERSDIYTIEINSGIRFHEDACFGGGSRELTAEDVKYSLDFACSGNALNSTNSILIDLIKGASEYQVSSTKKLNAKGVSGIKVIGNKIEITLKQPYVGFEAVLARENTVIFPHEAFEKYGDKIKLHPVGTGPFKFVKKDNDNIVLEKNKNYWKQDESGNQLPYLHSIKYIYFSDKKSEMTAFRNKEVDLISNIPSDEVNNIFGSLQDAVAGKNIKHKVESSLSLNIDYLGFNTEHGIFANKDLRQAIYYAVDQNEIIEKYLGGNGYAPVNGFVPVIEGALNETTIHSYNLEKAKTLLAKAGYPNGNGFPQTEIYVSGDEHSKGYMFVKGFVELMKKNLNLNFTIHTCSLEEKDKAIADGSAQIWRSGWIADFPSPITFLELFYSNNNRINKFNFKNEDYNKHFELAIKETDSKKRSYHFIKAQSLIAENAVVVPLFVDNMLILLNARVKGLVANQMEQMNLKYVYIKQPKS
ncbi:MAG TPA: ABC transporter substrate-binding protein [Taishania sp.]|nr:ABC transporter substrate-binding protein [Taishania sp.]